MVALYFAVGLRPSWPSLLHGCSGLVARLMPEAGFVAGAVVGDYSFADDPMGIEKAAARCQKLAAVMACSLSQISE